MRKEQVNLYQVTLLDIAEKKTKKPISKTQGEKLAADLGAEMYVECSALTGEGMKNVFDEVTMASMMMMMRLVMVRVTAFKQYFMMYSMELEDRTIFPLNVSVYFQALMAALNKEDPVPPTSCCTLL